MGSKTDFPQTWWLVGWDNTPKPVAVIKETNSILCLEKGGRVYKTARDEAYYRERRDALQAISKQLIEDIEIAARRLEEARGNFSEFQKKHKDDLKAEGLWVDWP
jgi:hypothetical protein